MPTIRQQVYDTYGDVCLLCGRTQEERTQPLSLHHLNGDESDTRVGNVVPLCQSCHVNIHRIDEPPYRFFHRLLPKEARVPVNQHTSKIYEGEGPQLDLDPPDG